MRERTTWWSTAALWAALVLLAGATALVCKSAFASQTRTAGSTDSGIPAPGSAVGTTMDDALPARILHLPLVDSNGKATDLAAFHGKILMISDIMTLCQET